MLKGFAVLQHLLAFSATIALYSCIHNKFYWHVTDLYTTILPPVAVMYHTRSSDCTAGWHCMHCRNSTVGPPSESPSHMRSANSVSVAARYPGSLDSSLLMSSCTFLAMGALCGALSGTCAALHVISTCPKDATMAVQSMGSIIFMQQHRHT